MTSSQPLLTPRVTRARPVVSRAVRTLITAFTLAAGASHAGGLLPSAVDSVTSGTNGGFGASFFPQNVLTGPHGGDAPPQLPNDAPEDLYSLGIEGSITLAWPANNVIVDGTGDDFTVFENVLENAIGGEPFVEAGIVAVSQDGVTFIEFPFAFLPPSGWDDTDPFAIPLFATNYSGLAGTRATLVTRTNGVDPGDPLVSGGDSFDLADVGLTWARYVRITDPGNPGMPSARTGTNGLAIYDLGNTLNVMPAAGFDLDTVVAINFGPPPPAAINDWTLY